METIKKQINVERIRSHFPGVMPYCLNTGSGVKYVTTGDTNGNYGQIMCDYSGYSETTFNILRKYYLIRNIIRGGQRLKRVEKNGVVCYTELFDDDMKSYYYKVKNRDDFEVFDYKTLKPISETYDTSDRYIALVSKENYDKYNLLGGMELIDLVESEIIGLVNVPNRIKGARVPDKFYLTKISEWLDWFSANEEAHNNFPINKGNCCETDEWDDRGGTDMRNFLTEKSSLLVNLLSIWAQRCETEGAITPPSLDIPVLVTQEYDDNGVMSVTDETIPYRSNGHEKIENAREPYTKGVQMESQLQMLRSRTRKYDDNGDLLPFIYTGSTTPTSGVSIPYVIGEKFNEYYDTDGRIKYDEITDTHTAYTSDDRSVKIRVFKYKVAGVLYEESYPTSDVVEDFLVNGAGSTTKITYEKIDFDNKKVTIYNRDFGLSREGNLTTMTMLPTGEIWNSRDAISSQVIKKEYLNHISEEPVIDVNIEFDRGNATAFESHLKLSECNTFEDMENYGNNYFNL